MKRGKQRSRGFTLVETVIAVALIATVSTMLTSAFVTQLKMLAVARERVSRTAEVDQAVVVASSWVNWASSTDIYASEGAATPATQGNALRVAFGSKGTAWVTLSNDGLYLTSTDGERVLLSQRIRPPLTGNAFELSVPTSPWADAAGRSSLYYTEPYSRSGVMIMHFSLVGDSSAYHRALVTLGL